LFPPESISILELSRERGISKSTLSTWKQQFTTNNAHVNQINKRKNFIKRGKISQIILCNFIEN
jgi:hypothetical protein